MTTPLHTQQDVACSNDPEMWFLTTKIPVREAKAFCEECPLKDPCLQMGLIPVFPEHHSSGLPHGIWGGLTREERAALVKKGAAA